MQSSPSDRRAFLGGVCGRRAHRWFHGGDDKKSGPHSHCGDDRQTEAQRLGSAQSPHLIPIHDPEGLRARSSVEEVHIDLRFLFRWNNIIPVWLQTLTCPMSYLWNSGTHYTWNAVKLCKLVLFIDAELFPLRCVGRSFIVPPPIPPRNKGGR